METKNTQQIHEFAIEWNAEMASEFIASTCELMPTSSLVHSDLMHNIIPGKSYEKMEYSILCGSHAEFYIRPLNTCIGDVDVIIADTSQLAFSGDFPVLPSNVSGMADTIQCYQTKPYKRYPGFVRLRHWGEVNYNWKLKQFSYTAAVMKAHIALNKDKLAAHYHILTLASSSLQHRPSIAGPAVKQRSNGDTNYFFGADFVISIWCSQWPTEAQCWLNRPRKNGWPKTDTISEVVRNGCNLVYIQHRSCRDDKRQWRFSFSLAEVTLLQSWTQTQQIVYHLLRFFAKRELMQKDCAKEDEVLCTYHIKTLMLWTCEEMSSKWWNSASIITICSELLKTLSEWLEKKHCSNYFIPEANLIQEQSNNEMIEKTIERLKEFHSSDILCRWFVENYILSNMRRYFNLMTKTPYYSDIILPLLEYWNINQLNSVELCFHKTFAYTHDTCRSIMTQGFVLGLRNCLDIVRTSRSFELKAHWRHRNLPAIHLLCFTYYDNLLCILHTAYGLGCGEISLEGSLLVESLNAVSMQPKIIKSKYHNFPETGKTQSSMFQLLRAQCLMENLNGSNSCSEFQILSLMTKELLRKALECVDTQSNGIVPVALGYLSAFHFASSEHQKVIRLCLDILEEQTIQKDEKTLNAICLLFIDDIARIVGLRVLQKKITEKNLHYINRRLHLDLRLSPKVFAHYLSGLSYMAMSTNSDLCPGSQDSSFPVDAYLLTLLKPKCISSKKSGAQFNNVRQIVYCRPYSSSSVNPLIVKERVYDALMEYGFENMTSFYNVMQNDYDVNCNPVDCYRALYLYKCCQYDQVLNFCETVLKDSDLLNDLKEFAFANVLLFPPLDSYFDRDVQSLLGFHTLFYYLYPLNEDLWRIDWTSESSFEHCFAREVYHTKLQTSIILKHDYCIKFHYFLGRLFIAKYLKLRCCVDCNLPYSEAFTKLDKHKTDLPFEHTIRRFLLRKILRCTLRNN